MVIYLSMGNRNNNKMRNVLFIGGAGFIGSSIIKQFLNADDERDIYVLEPPFANLSRLYGMPVHIIQGNISDIDLIKSIIEIKKIYQIVHLVSTMVPGCDYEDYKKEFENVIFPTVRLMQLCSKKNVRLAFFSSGGTIYGERTNNIPFVESDPKEPISYYGLSKQVLENSILFEHRVSGLQYLIIRPSNPYGPGQNINGRQGLIAVALGKILSGQPVTVWGDGSSVRDYIYIDDLAMAVSELLKNDNICNKTINIGSGKGYSVGQILDIIVNTVSEDVTIEYSAGRQNDVSNMVLDISQMKSLVKIPHTSIEKGIKLFYKYEKSLLKT